MRRTLLFLSLCLAAACGPGGGQPARDAAIIEVSYELPDGCPPAEPNNEGIGRPCTKGGGQCGDPLRCACDPYLGVQLTGLPCVCTKVQLAPIGSTNPCGPPLAANFCGANATCCAYLTSVAYCVPDICLSGGMCLNFVPDDAGAPDAPATSDAGAI